MPQVSVLLTCYNHLRYLPMCLDSLGAQSFRDFEVIALDDGSTDGTREYLTDWATNAAASETWRNIPIRLIFHEHNVGTYASLNVGVTDSSGEFVAILNDDDVWMPTKLERQVELFRSMPELGLVHTHGYFIDEHGKRQDQTILNFEFPKTHTGFVLPTLIRHNKIINSATLIRKDVIRKVGLFDSAFYGCGDWDMWLRIAAEYPIGCVDEPLTLYRVHGQNACLDGDRMRRDDQRVREKIAAREKELLSKYPHAKELRQALAHNWACLGTVRTLHGDAAGGRRAYWKSILLMPSRIKSWLRLPLTFLPARWYRAFI